MMIERAKQSKKSNRERDREQVSSSSKNAQSAKCVVVVGLHFGLNGNRLHYRAYHDIQDSRIQM